MRRHRLHHLVLVASALLLAAPVDANAAPAAKPKAPLGEEAAIEEAAKARYAEGLKLYAKKRYEEARVAFVQASALKKRPASTFMLAQCSLQAGRYLEALKTFDAYVAEVDGDVPPKMKPVLDDGRANAKAHLGRVRFDVPSGSEVTIDGEKVASLEEPVDVMPGKHAIVITHRGEKKTEQIEATAGATVSVKPVFIPKALVPTADTRTRPTPGNAASTNASASSASSASSSSESGSSILAPPQTTWPVYVAGAVGLGGLAAAAIFGGLAANSSHASEVARETLIRTGRKTSICDGPDRAQVSDVCVTIEHNDSVARGHKAVFQTSLIVGISGTAIAIGWFVFAPKEGSAERPAPTPPAKDAVLKSTRVTPWLGLESGGISMEGRF